MNNIDTELVYVTIQTLHNRIQGAIGLRKGERVIDELDKCSKFLSVTDTVVFDMSGNRLYKSSHMVINTKQIISLISDADNIGNIV